MTDKQLHRRDFLKLLGAGAGALPVIGGLGGLSALAGESLLSAQPALASGASASGVSAAPLADEASLVADMRSQLEALFANKEMALVFSRIDDDGTENFRIEINAQELYPVASSFKAWLVLYYFMNTPQDEWQTDSQSLVYRVAVYSNNGSTGRLIDYMGDRVPGDGNAIEKFNDFIIDVLKLDNGLYSWNWPGTPTVGFYDERFTPTQDRIVRIRTMTQSISNLSTAADLARGWEFIIRAREHERWSDPHFQAAINASREVLAIAANGYLSPIEMVLNSGYIGKDGTLPFGDLEVGRVINDAGIVRVPTAQYLISFMSTGETEESTRPALQQVVDSMRAYEAQYHPSYQTYMTGESHPIYPEGYNYGIVRRQAMSLYYEPGLDAPQIDNPVRRNTVFGMMYVMQGAMLRFLPVDDEWGELIKDDALDDVFTFPDWSAGFNQANWMANPPRHIYFRLEDVLVLGREHFTEEIGFISGAPENTDKFIILDVPRRLLTLFEGPTAVLKTPVVLNMDATPRGRLYVNRRLIARNMPHYPGVPYTNFLHDGNDLNSIGYALHGAPWHRWADTVTRRETLRRYSHGCINVPNWELPIGDYTLPVDEFVFRWIGSFPNPAEDRHYIPQRGQPYVRVYSHNNVYQEIFDYQPPDSVFMRGNSWNDVLDSLDAIEVSAPDSFFEPTLL